VQIADVAGRGWTLADLPTPAMVLRERSLTHNLALMQEYCRAWAVDIAPHGKTTMAPQLWERQLAAGAWGITAATIDQARVMRSTGVPRVLVANELVDPVSIAWVAGQLADPAFELLCYVDSDRTVDILDAGLRAAHAERRLPVLVELGFAGGRTGCRTIPEAVHVGSRVRSTSTLALAGVAGYEGTSCHERSAECVALVVGFLDRLRELTSTMIDAGSFEGTDRIVLSAGGSAFFDLVVDRLHGQWPSDADVRLVLRSGCYLTHDAGMYERLSPLPSRDGERGFQPAMELWSHVLSRPEPELAILGFGKRDVSFDVDLPTPFVVRSVSGSSVGARDELEIRSLNDQHAYGWVRPGSRLDVGDRVGLGISHPCTSFDKWRAIAVVDDDDRVVDAIATFF
jgi:D-serine deaminase-like pyridoxal phosphate-dependent protein